MKYSITECAYSYSAHTFAFCSGCLSPEALAALSAFRAEKADELSAARQQRDAAAAAAAATAATDFVSEDYGKSQFWVRPRRQPRPVFYHGGG